VDVTTAKKMFLHDERTPSCQRWEREKQHVNINDYEHNNSPGFCNPPGFDLDWSCDIEKSVDRYDGQCTHCNTDEKIVQKAIAHTARVSKQPLILITGRY
jgi:hypothetical protein